MDLLNLSAGYISARRKIVIQSGISDSLNKGEFTCMLGPNGAGKSTLLRTLGGFIPPLEGSILLDGENISLMSPAELSKKVSVVLTERPSVSSMTVEQLVALGRSPYTGFWGRLTDKDRRVVEDALKATGAFSLKERLVDTLSDGERQKVMVAKALAQETPVILLDESTAFLDFPSKAEMMMMLKRLAREKNKVVVLSTHDLNLALTLADRLWLVDKKQGVRTGTPRQLAEDGSLPLYFLRSGITFDADTLSFSVKSQF